MFAASECAGFAASALVLLTFAMKDMRSLRLTAICSNIAFITYGVLHWLPPVIVLHIMLLPINLYHLLINTANGRGPEGREAAAVKARRQAMDALQHSVTLRSKPCVEANTRRAA